jgi:methionyl-tRNA synthetase
VRRLNRYVEERAPWQLAKEPSDAAELDRVLASLTEGLRVLAVLLWPYLPASVERLLAALGSEQLELAGAQMGAGRVERVGELASLFPKQAAAGAQ